MKNEQGKTRKVNEPYEVWVREEWVWRVLKKYQSPDNEAKNEYARWFCAVESPFTKPGYEMGDTYVSEITKFSSKMSEKEMTEYLKKNHWKEIGGQY